MAVFVSLSHESRRRHPIQRAKKAQWLRCNCVRSRTNVQMSGPQCSFQKNGAMGQQGTGKAMRSWNVCGRGMGNWLGQTTSPSIFGILGGLTGTKLVAAASGQLELFMLPFAFIHFLGRPFIPADFFLGLQLTTEELARELARSQMRTWHSGWNNVFG